MIQKYVDRYMERKDAIRKFFAVDHLPRAINAINEYREIEYDSRITYEDIIRVVVSNISKEYGDPDPEKIHSIHEDGGPLLFILPGKGYPPCYYYIVKVHYGTCSGCDALEEIYGLIDRHHDVDGAIECFMLLSLHIVQNLKKI